MVQKFPLVLLMSIFIVLSILVLSPFVYASAAADTVGPTVMSLNDKVDKYELKLWLNEKASISKKADDNGTILLSSKGNYVVRTYPVIYINSTGNDYLCSLRNNSNISTFAFGTVFPLYTISYNTSTETLPCYSLNNTGAVFDHSLANVTIDAKVENISVNCQAAPGRGAKCAIKANITLVNSTDTYGFGYLISPNPSAALFSQFSRVDINGSRYWLNSSLTPQIFDIVPNSLVFYNDSNELTSSTLQFADLFSVYSNPLLRIGNYTGEHGLLVVAYNTTACNGNCTIFIDPAVIDNFMGIQTTVFSSFRRAVYSNFSDYVIIYGTSNTSWGYATKFDTNISSFTRGSSGLADTRNECTLAANKSNNVYALCNGGDFMRREGVNSWVNVSSFGGTFGRPSMTIAANGSIYAVSRGGGSGPGGTANFVQSGDGGANWGAFTGSDGIFNLTVASSSDYTQICYNENNKSLLFMEENSSDFGVSANSAMIIYTFANTQAATNISSSQGWSNNGVGTILENTSYNRKAAPNQQHTSLSLACTQSVGYAAWSKPGANAGIRFAKWFPDNQTWSTPKTIVAMSFDTVNATAVNLTLSVLPNVTNTSDQIAVFFATNYSGAMNTTELGVAYSTNGGVSFTTFNLTNDTGALRDDNSPNSIEHGNNTLDQHVYIWARRNLTGQGGSADFHSDIWMGSFNVTTAAANTIPIIIITTANNTSTNAAIPTITVNVTDNEQLSTTVTIWKNGTNVSYTLVQNNTLTGMQWNLTANTDGVWSYYGSAYDNTSNNVTEGNRTLIRDTAIPNLLASTQMHIDKVVSNNTWLANFTLSDNLYVDKMLIEFNGVNYSFTGNNGSGQSAISAYFTRTFQLRRGNNTIVAYANDSATNADFVNGWVFWDNGTRVGYDDLAVRNITNNNSNNFANLTQSAAVQFNVTVDASIINQSGTNGGSWIVNMTLWNITNKGGAATQYGSWVVTNISTGNGINVFSIATGDFNSDGLTDIVYGQLGTSTLSIAQNTGNINITGWGITNRTGIAGNFFGIAAADMDGDNLTDIIVGSSQGKNITILKNSGGAFTAWTTYNVSLASSVNSLAVGDIDGNGAVDVLAGTAGSKVNLYNNSGDFNPDEPNISNWTTYNMSITGGNSVKSLAIGDLNNDSLNDIVITHAANINILVNDGVNNNITRWQAYNVTTADTTLVSAIGDINGDGLNDLVVGIGGGGDRVSIYKNAGFTTPNISNWTTGNATPTSDDIQAIVLRDINSDGNLDIVVGIAVGFSGTTAYINPGGGNIQLNLWPVTSLTEAGGTSSVNSITAEDFNNDGDIDIVDGISGGASASGLLMHNNSDINSTYITSQLISYTSVPPVSKFFNLNWTPTQSGNTTLYAIANGVNSVNDLLRTNNFVTQNVTVLSSNTVPKIYWQHANNTYNKTLAVSWVNLTFNFTDSDTDVWVATLFANSTNVSFNNSAKNNTPTNLSANLSDGIWNLYVQVSDNSSSNNSEILFLHVSTDFDGDDFNATFDCNNNNIAITPLNNNSETIINRTATICPATYSNATVRPTVNTSIIIDFNNSAKLNSTIINVSTGYRGAALNFTSIENVTVVNLTLLQGLILSDRGLNNTIANSTLQQENISLNNTGRLYLLNTTRTIRPFYGTGSTTFLATQWYDATEVRYQHTNQPANGTSVTITAANSTQIYVLTTQTTGLTPFKIFNESDQNISITLQYNSFTFLVEQQNVINSKTQTNTTNSSQAILIYVDPFSSPSAPGGGGGGGGGGGPTANQTNQSLPCKNGQILYQNFCCNDLNKNGICDYLQIIQNITLQENITAKQNFEDNDTMTQIYKEVVQPILKFLWENILIILLIAGIIIGVGFIVYYSL